MQWTPGIARSTPGARKRQRPQCPAAGANAKQPDVRKRAEVRLPITRSLTKPGSSSLRMLTAEGASHAPVATRRRNDREADFRCGANPQRRNRLSAPAED